MCSSHVQDTDMLAYHPEVLRVRAQNVALVEHVNMAQRCDVVDLPYVLASVEFLNNFLCADCSWLNVC